MSESMRAEWVATAARDKTFAEVGCLWGTVNEQVTVAAAGATELTMIDVAPDGAEDGNLWRLFRERVAEHGVHGVREIHGNIDDQRIAEEAGTFDTVHCSGVRDHCPEPLRTLRCPRAITREALILGTATMLETVNTAAARSTWSLARRCSCQP